MVASLPDRLMSVGNVGIDEDGNLWYDKLPSNNVDLSINDEGNLVAEYENVLKGNLQINSVGELEVIA